MERRYITCPETAHLEAIDFEHSPDGILIAGCSRFSPRGALACTRECARRMDRREHRDQDARTERILVAHAGANAQTIAVAGALAAELRADGTTVELADLDARAAPPPADYDAVVIASPIRIGRFARSARAYVEDHADELAALPGFTIAVSRSPRGSHRAHEQLFRRTRWQPCLSVTFDRGAWFGDPDTHVAPPSIRELARSIADELPSLETRYAGCTSCGHEQRQPEADLRP